MNITKDITKSSLQIQSVHQLIKLSKGQDALLKLIRESVKESKILDWDALVKCFYDNVSKNIWRQHYIGRDQSNYPKYETLVYDLWKGYKENTDEWKRYGRVRIKNWFERSVGTLVVKGQLFVIPTIELE